MRKPARFVSVEPSVFVVGGSHDNVAAPTETSATVIANAGSVAPALPSLTLMTMLEYVPTLAAAGVPESWPVAVLKLAHAGRFAIENVNASPFASDALGRKLYALPAFTEVAGEPL